MHIEQLYTNCLAQAAYYVESNGEVAIIDPIRDYQIYIDKAKNAGHTIKYIFETHFHADFVSGHVDLSKQTGAPIIYGPTAKTGFDATIATDGQVFNLGEVTITALHTPGHTPESTCFLLKNADGTDHCVFTGDTLFVGDVGRPDLLDGNPDLNTEKMAGWLYDSLNSKLKPLADNVIVYPAHGPGSACGKSMGKETFSTIGVQKASNYAMADISKEEFITQVTDGITPPPDYFFKDAKLNKMGYASISDVSSNGMQALSVDAFDELRQNGALVIDSRDPLEFENGFIPGAINIGLNGQYAIWAATLFDLDRKIILLTSEGSEQESVTRLARVGFDNICGYLNGGFDAWQQAGKKIDLLVSVDSEELGLEQKHGKNIGIIDVRKPSEFEGGHVEGAEFITLATLQDHLVDLDRDKDYYVYCAGGYRSVIACSMMKANGLQRIRNVYGGYGAIKNDERVALTLPVTA
jgi:glyoxylase-like metal-dependent hydrolase (beta-lactamase superfamily II)/rhodanese-related sulfurtransferase